jgi:putative hydrolase
MDKNKVKILGHIDNPAVPFDFDLVLAKAKEKDILIEVNNASYGYVRPGSYEVGKELLLKAKEIGNKIILNSDSHYHEQVGDLEKSIQLITEVTYPGELIVNSDIEHLKEYFIV